MSPIPISSQETIAAVATPPGQGGIAVIRISGPSSHAIVDAIFAPADGGAPSAFSGYSVHYGAILDSASGETIDDGLLTLFKAPHSYTGEDGAEISCHGGTANANRVLRVTLDAGARLADPGEFTQRAFLNGRVDLAQAEAVADLIHAQTEASRRQARRQLDGGLSQAIAGIRNELLGILASIEVTIDFSDEVGDLAYEPLAGRIHGAVAVLETILTTFDRGRILRDGLRVAIVGRPNVGKSSLLNAMLRAERAIVTPVPGTTRDLVEENAVIQGIPIVLTDTAGMRDTEDLVERIGVERAKGAAANADVVLFVFDAAMSLRADDLHILARLHTESDVPVIAVANKSDLNVRAGAAETMQLALQGFGLAGGCRFVSALTGEGVTELEESLFALCTRGAMSGRTSLGDARESAVLTNTRHKEAVAEAASNLREAEKTTRAGLPGDFIALDIRGALDALGRITGETVTEDIVHRIFHDFCVGK